MMFPYRLVFHKTGRIIMLSPHNNRVINAARNKGHWFTLERQMPWGSFREVCTFQDGLISL